MGCEIFMNYLYISIYNREKYKKVMFIAKRPLITGYLSKMLKYIKVEHFSGS